METSRAPHKTLLLQPPEYRRELGGKKSEAESSSVSWLWGEEGISHAGMYTCSGGI